MHGEESFRTVERLLTRRLFSHFDMRVSEAFFNLVVILATVATLLNADLAELVVEGAFAEGPVVWVLGAHELFDVELERVLVFGRGVFWISKLRTT